MKMAFKRKKRLKTEKKLYTANISIVFVLQYIKINFSIQPILKPHQHLVNAFEIKKRRIKNQIKSKILTSYFITEVLNITFVYIIFFCLH